MIFFFLLFMFSTVHADTQNAFLWQAAAWSDPTFENPLAEKWVSEPYADIENLGWLDEPGIWIRFKTKDGKEWESPSPLLNEHLVKHSKTAYTFPTSAQKKLFPYLLPEGHPIKPFLDRIFTQSRAILNLKTLKEAGFLEAEPRKFTHLIVTKHPEAPGYVFKIYLDAQRHYKNKPEYYFWKQRIKGANAIRESIAAHHLESFFKVPQKWIYLLPQTTLKPSYHCKHSILVEEDMGLLTDKENKNKYKNFITEEWLIAIFTILEEVGLSDCAKPDNIPFTQEGKIAFIDTQTHHQWPVQYAKLGPFLSTTNQKFWKQLTK